MTIQAPARTTLLIAGAMMFVGVALGAFGAHGMKHVGPQMLATWETGARYLLLHALALLALGLICHTTSMALTWPRRLIIAGTILFSGNCFIYVLTGIKIFAIIIPVGGTLLLVGWAWFVWEFASVSRRTL